MNLQSDEKPNRRRDLFEEAKKLDILVKDKCGHPYMVPNTAFDVGMLDLTHPNTAIWFKKILKEMVDDGVRGWMADFGEGLPVDATVYSGIVNTSISFESSHGIAIIQIYPAFLPTIDRLTSNQ